MCNGKKEDYVWLLVTLFLDICCWPLLQKVHCARWIFSLTQYKLPICSFNWLHSHEVKIINSIQFVLLPWILSSPPQQHYNQHFTGTVQKKAELFMRLLLGDSWLILANPFVKWPCSIQHQVLVMLPWHWQGLLVQQNCHFHSPSLWYYVHPEEGLHLLLLLSQSDGKHVP